MADEPAKDQDEPAPQGKTASTIRETAKLAREVSGWGPQQLNGVAFALLVVAVIGFLGWRIYQEDRKAAVESQANVERQSQLLRFMESESEKSRQLNNQSVKEGQSFYSQESEKYRKYYADQERIRLTEGKLHMQEAFKNMQDQARKIESLGASIDKLSGAVNAFTKKMEQSPHN